MEYVAGFLFSEDRERVVLIKKNKPAWQKGCLNGVGGKIEPGETNKQAMRREFLEETGLDISTWREVIDLSSPAGWVVHFFTAYGDVDQAKTMTEEEVVVASVKSLPENVLYNLHWLVPIGLDETLQFPIKMSEGSGAC